MNRGNKNFGSIALRFLCSCAFKGFYWDYFAALGLNAEY